MLTEITICGRRESVGLDVQPRISWKIKSDRSDVMQTSFRIIVQDESHIVWDSGSVSSDRSIHVLYEGEALAPFTKYQVQVTAIDHYGDAHAGSASFETGMMTEENFKASWITHTLPAEETAPAVFCKDIKLEETPIRSARIYATACGVYDILLNGEK